MAFRLGRGIGKSSSVRVTEVLTQIALGMGIGITSNAIVEVSHVPVLNDSGTFGNTKMSNFELFVNGIALAGIGAGVIDMGSGKGVLTFTRSMVFYLVGIIIGVYFYDHTLATMLKIRNFNPYHTLAKRIPAVLPSSTKLPFLQPGSDITHPMGGKSVPVAPMI